MINCPFDATSSVKRAENINLSAGWHEIGNQTQISDPRNLLGTRVSEDIKLNWNRNDDFENKATIVICLYGNTIVLGVKISPSNQKSLLKWLSQC